MLARKGSGEKEGRLGVGGLAFNISPRFNAIIHGLLAGRKVPRCPTR